MNDIDPAKMTSEERMTLFASLTKDLTPAASARRTIADQIAPWVAAIAADRARGLDWQQLALVCTTKLKIKVSARSLERVVRNATAPSNARKKRRQPATKSPVILSAAKDPAADQTSAKPSPSANPPSAQPARP